MTSFYTRAGDDGYTGLFGEGRVAKYMPQPEAYGTVDEANAALGIARAAAQSEQTRQLLLVTQRDLYRLMAELAATQQTAAQFRSIDAARVHWLEEQTDAVTALVVLPRDFAHSPGWFGYGSYGDDVLAASVVNIAGFPIDKPAGTLWGHARRVSRVTPNALFYEIDTYGGRSGAPVVCWDGNDYVAVGIHNYGDLAGNRATRINASVFANLDGWAAELD